MYIGIKYEQKLKNVNRQLSSFGSALMFRGVAKYYFNNPIVAMRVARFLSLKNSNFKYSLCELSEKETKNKLFIKNYKDFDDYVNRDREEASL